MAKLETHNDLKSNTRKTVIDILNARLADAIDLALIIKQAHWNVKGPTFIAVHELLDQLRKDQDEHVDTVAERVAQLGGMALGTSQSVASRTPLPAYPTDISKISQHLEALVERYAMTAKLVRKAIEDCDEAGDADAADIFTAYSRSLDKNLWFLESHLQPG
ncbi:MULTISPECIES: DNA starvation/stationary phase protection protein Dps [Mesorhizobium]|uniref:DNA starvation/stationary phase protection protein Dps n=1 Tax=Mesorhizobium denitrificans TaxID=2294114 RepID=A0A371XCR8_9HYPH|nr:MULTISPECIES: DNA starvation/stationary phase protection protein Dps [Mesorhizobium]RFC67025.1 DNA starvation/stationary phase protection protein Dps [Mesorhizobium denitrificans]